MIVFIKIWVIYVKSLRKSEFMMCRVLKVKRFLKSMWIKLFGRVFVGWRFSIMWLMVSFVKLLIG